MELYEIKEKVGSDPCLVLDYQFILDESRGGLVSNIKHFETLEEAKNFVNEFSNLLKELSKTHCVILNASISNTGVFNEASLCLSTLFFNRGVDNLLYVSFVGFLALTLTTITTTPFTIVYDGAVDIGYDVYWFVKID